LLWNRKPTHAKICGILPEPFGKVKIDLVMKPMRQHQKMIIVVEQMMIQHLNLSKIR
jgi:hypothetical protein